ncbi:uncharacterized protein TrAFT101_010519 [Trichoderma asperellum]|uniref:uncharacterized protein n=1 Tax=Trichoderma asperellum TaxID=101201 RepID=UPI00332DEACF|nr:hypothetical protein TrAFT101_010519 [Trichoderma asperellum]
MWPPTNSHTIDSTSFLVSAPMPEMDAKRLCLFHSSERSKIADSSLASPFGSGTSLHASTATPHSHRLFDRHHAQEVTSASSTKAALPQNAASALLFGLKQTAYHQAKTALSSAAVTQPNFQTN